MNIIDFFQNHEIEFIRSGHKHCRSGWIQIKCPFCTGNPGWHMGYCINPEEPYFQNFICWRCGGKNKIKTISALTNTSYHQAKQILKEYGGTLKYQKKRTPPKKKILRDIKLPKNIPITYHKKAKAYLQKRNFEPKKLYKLWNVRVTWPFESYGNRILIPIYYQGKIVSFTTRDYTGKSAVKYKTCQKSEETLFHKHILYGIDHVETPFVIVVEGVLDVWRFGKGNAVATFGVKYTDEQVRLLERFENVFVAFDPDKQGQIQSEKLCDSLAFRGVNAHHIKLEKSDPAGMKKNEIKNILKMIKAKTEKTHGYGVKFLQPIS